MNKHYIILCLYPLKGCVLNFPCFSFSKMMDKDGFAVVSASSATVNQLASPSIYSSGSETSLGPKVSSTVSTLPMGSPKHTDSAGT